MLNIKKVIKDEKAVFELDGRLDTVSAPELEKAFKETLDGVKEVVLDFKGLKYLSSAGLRVLLAAQKSMMQAGGSMKLINVNEIIMDIFEVTGFLDILDIE